MIKHYRTPDNIIIEGLVDHSQGYDENSFVVEKADRTTVPFLLEILGEDSVKINFEQETTDKRLLVFVKLYNFLGEIVLKEILISDLNIEEENEEDVELVELEIFGSTISITGIDGAFPKDVKCYIKGYNLEQYSDFPHVNEQLTLNADEDGKVISDIYYPFVVDIIYDILVVYKNKKYTKTYIHEQPTLYWSSVYHVIQASNELGLLIDSGKQTKLDLSILIWRYSKLAFGIAGIVEITVESTKAILTEYVTQKTLLHFVTKSIRDINLTPGLAEGTLGKLQVSLGDFQHGSPVETITSQLIKTHKELRSKVDEMEEKLPEYFRYLQATKTVESKGYKGLTVDRIQNFWESE